MNLEKSPLWEYLFLVVFIFFGFLVTFHISPYVGNGDAAVTAFYGIPIEEHFHFVALALYYGFIFVSLQVVTVFAFVAAWLVNCIGIHIQYRKPQRVYPPKNK